MHRHGRTVPRVTNFDDADITDLERLRQSSKEDYAAQGFKLTTMPFLIKAVATALRHHPSINAVIDEENEQSHLQRLCQHWNRGRHRSWLGCPRDAQH